MTDDARNRNRLAPVIPSTVSQLTCLQTYGIDPRRFRKIVGMYRNDLRITRMGKLVLVRVEDFDALLERLAEDREAAANDGDTDQTTTGDRSPVATEFETADEILAAVGHRRVVR